MKKTIILFYLFSAIAFAQLSVKDNSFIYNKGALLFVKQDINLAGSNANIYLRKEGQLQQGTASTSSNYGTGALSVFQEGTVNNYIYNYWCSPIGNPASTGNQPFGIGMLYRPTSKTASTAATNVSWPNFDGSTSATTLVIANYWIWRFLSALNYSEWDLVAADATKLAAGQGFTMKGTSGTDTANTTAIDEGTANNAGSNQRYDFRGRPNDGNIVVNLAANKFTLTGNPYSSALDLQSFLNDPANTDCDGTALFWSQVNIASHNIASYQGGYGTYNATTNAYTVPTNYTFDGSGNQGASAGTSGPDVARKFVPIGQGFMLRGKTGLVGTGAVTLKNTHRVFVKESATLTDATTTHFLKTQNTTTYPNYPEILNVAGIDYTQISTAPTPQMLINVDLNNEGVRQLALCFMPNALDGVDRADSISPDNDNANSMDSYLVLGNDQYVHSTRPFNLSNRYPIAFRNVNAATYKIKVHDFINFDQTQNVYLYDGATGLYYDIKDAEYSLTLPAGTNTTQYEITFTNSFLNTNNTNFAVLQLVNDNATENIKINNPNAVDVKNITVYDITGKQIIVKENIGTTTSYLLSTTTLSEGVYLVKVTANEKSFTQKIIVQKSK